MRHKVLYVCMCIAFLLALIASNSLVAAAYNNGNMKSISDPAPCLKDETYFCIDKVEYYKNLPESISFLGWSFCETTENNDKKSISLLFSSQTSGKHYIVSTSGFGRPDVQQYFMQEKNINGVFHGFSTEFSPLGMSNGEYELWIICHENETNYGAVNTSRVFVKTSSSFYEKEGQA